MKTCPVCGSEWSDDTRFCPKDGSTLRAAEGADLIGSIIADRYHIEKKLGEGGMGAVYLGEHVKMGRKSAIKVMSQSMASDPDAIARFNREAANAARINHPNVCAIYDFGETDDGTIYLAMEFIEGESLNDLLKREGALTLDRAADILQQTGQALQAAHDLGIVHRDLKPDNIMLSATRDGADVVKVVDFGIAKAMSGEEGQKVTKTGLVVGTPEYMSPEQLSGDVLDGRSDIYSLALVFFRTVTGVLPFQAETSQETMIKRLTDDPLKLVEVAPDAGWPPRLQGVMDRALERMPADRYESAALFAKDVSDAVLGTGRAAVGVDTDAATQVMGAGGVTDQMVPTRVSGHPEATAQRPELTTPQTPVPAPSAPSARRKRTPVVAIAAAAVVVVAGGGVALKFMGGGAEQPGGAPAAAESTAVAAADSGQLVTQAETEPPGGGQPAAAGQGDQQPTGARQDPEQQRPVTDPPVTPVIDRSAIDQELFDMIDLIDEPATRARAMLRAEEIYETDGMPDDLRAAAANTLGFGHQLNSSMDIACDWVGRAMRLAPDNARYSDMFERMGCTS